VWRQPSPIGQHDLPGDPDPGVARPNDHDVAEDRGIVLDHGQTATVDHLRDAAAFELERERPRRGRHVGEPGSRALEL
jgi:hypothetical protein